MVKHFMLFNKKTFIIIAVTIMLGGVYGGLREWTAASSESTDRSNISVSDLMASLNMYHIKEPQTPPDFTLSSLDGEDINLAANRGNVVLLSFWATW